MSLNISIPQDCHKQVDLEFSPFLPKHCHFTRCEIPANPLIFFNRSFGNNFGIGSRQSVPSFVKFGQDLDEIKFWEFKFQDCTGLSDTTTGLSGSTAQSGGVYRIVRRRCLFQASAGQSGFWHQTIRFGQGCCPIFAISFFCCVFASDLPFPLHDHTLCLL